MECQKVKVIPVVAYSRVVGYYRPISCFNHGKKQEHKERVLICKRPVGQVSQLQI